MAKYLLIDEKIASSGAIATDALGQLTGASASLCFAEIAATTSLPLVLLARDSRHADQLEAEIRWFAPPDIAVRHFAEWETLPYDTFSPHQDIVSERLATLASMRAFRAGVLICTVSTLLQRLPPVDYVATRSLLLQTGQRLQRDAFVDSLIAGGYARVPQADEHGEFAVRGSLIDVFPMGSDKPVRIDFFDDEIESLRFYSPGTQLSGEKIDRVDILPAREVPMDGADVQAFRRRYRERFEGQPSRSRVYRDVSDGIAHGGIEYYLPLFFDSTANLLDYLPAKTLVVSPVDWSSIIEQTYADVEERYELCRHDVERPILAPDESFFGVSSVVDRMADFRVVTYSNHSIDAAQGHNIPSRMLPPLRVESRYEDAAGALTGFLAAFSGQVLITAESPGRREHIVELLLGRQVHATRVESWQAFADFEGQIAIAVAPLDSGVALPEAAVALVTEQHLFGEKPKQRNRRRRIERDPETIIRELNDLQVGSPVVHAEYGVGRYLGLTVLEAGGAPGEFLHLEYADGDKLYVPVHALELISRYTGASPENAPLHRLGSDQWAKAKRRAIKKIRDVAAELLDVYARRAARPGHRFRWPEGEYRAFEDGFPV